MKSKQHFETLAIHEGQAPDSATGAIITPIYQTSTYAQEQIGITKGFDYSRTANPTRLALEQCLAALENPEQLQPTYSLAFSSGLAATDTLLRLIKPGEHVLASNDVYGGTFRLFDKIVKNYGVQFSYTDITDPNLVETALRPETRLVWLETPTNPLLKIADIAEISRRVKARYAQTLIAVDNTFASPYLQQPLSLGADFVVHSTTKYLSGHSDVIGGAIVIKDIGLYEKLKFLQNAIGAIPGPQDCWLTLRGIKTLALRMERHSSNATEVANFLGNHSAIESVIYPGLERHPGHIVAKKQMKLYGGMLSVILKGGAPAAKKLVEGTKIFTLAESLGGVESLIEVPAVMTHASVAGSALEVPAGLVRLSVGIENITDLIQDLEQALTAI